MIGIREGAMAVAGKNYHKAVSEDITWRSSFEQFEKRKHALGEESRFNKIVST